MTEASKRALLILRDPAGFDWSVIPIFVLVIYVYAVEIQKRDWSTVLAGVAFWGMDLFNEIWNALVLHFTGRSAVWTAVGKTSFEIFVGLNLEITLMFAILGIVCVKFMPQDPTAKVWGLPNRWVFAVMNSILCVIVEILLNAAGVLVWEYSWWNFPNVFLITLLGYLPFMVVSFFVYDRPTLKGKLLTVGIILAVDLFAITLFGGILKWI